MDDSDGDSFTSVEQEARDYKVTHQSGPQPNESTHACEEEIARARGDEERAALVAAEKAKALETVDRPIDYEHPVGSGFNVVTPQAVYAEFATRLRRMQRKEAAIFKEVGHLAELVMRSDEIGIPLTPEFGGQLQAFVLEDEEAARAKQESPLLKTPKAKVAAQTPQTQGNQGDLSISVDVRTSILETEIRTYVNRGWYVTSHTATSVQLSKDNPPSWGIALLLALLFVIPAVLYLIFYKRTETLYLQVDERGDVVRSGLAD
jgi:hypothetical protein